MFKDCTALLLAPDLPATTLASSCYEEMFSCCSSLNYKKAMFVEYNIGALTQWVNGVSAQGTFVKNSKATWTYYGANGIPTGWEVVSSDDNVNVIQYNKYKAGCKPVTLVVIPDGFTEAELHSFRNRAQDGINALFNVSPFKEYKDYFNVYIIEVPSADSGVNVTDGNGNIIESKDCYFGSGWGRDSYGDMKANESKVQSFVSAYCPDISSGEHSIRDVPIAILANDTRYGGLCISSSVGDSYCIIPYSFSGGSISWRYPERESASNQDSNSGYKTVSSTDLNEMGVTYGNWKNIFVHEFGGHAFGRLADEYWYGNNSASSSNVTGHTFSTPFGLNVSGSYYDVPWQELLDNQSELESKDPHYSRMGIYQGGDVYMFGRWRNERISCMIDNRLYFSAWQRYLITKRIMTLSGCIDEFSFDSWVTNDNTVDPLRDNQSSTTISSPVSGVVHQEELLLPPVLIEK